MDEAKLIELMISWEKGYIAPSAQIVFRDARILLEEKIREVNKLRGEVYDLQCELDNARNSGGGPVGHGGNTQPENPSELRGEKSSTTDGDSIPTESPGTAKVRPGGTKRVSKGRSPGT